MVENFSQISVADFKQELDTEKYILIDCRTLQEQTLYGIITEKQILVDVYQPTALQEIEKLDKRFPYLVYCWHGNRSKMLRDFMQSQGFETVMDLEGGIDMWNKNLKSF